MVIVAWLLVAKSGQVVNCVMVHACVLQDSQEDDLELVSTYLKVTAGKFVQKDV